MKKKSQHKIIFWAIATIILGLFFAKIIQNDWFLSLHLKSSNFLYHQSENQALDDIVIVAIDDKSLLQRNASELGILQFNKSDYAQVLENLEEAGAKAIGIDIIFTEKGDAWDHATLVKTLTQYDDIILATVPKTQLAEALKPREEFIEPHPENLGAILFSPDRDNTIRRQKLFFEDEELLTSFSIQIVKKYLGLLPEDSRNVEGGYELMPFSIRANNKKYPPITIPLNTEETFMVNFFGEPYSFQTISFSDAHQGNFIERKTNEELDLNGKIILIGEMGTGLHDEQYVPTSFGAAMPGVEIHANAIQTILSQNFLKEQTKQSVILMVVLMIAIGLAAFLFLNIAFSLTAFFFGIIIYMVTTWISFEYGFILNTIHPYIALFTALGTAYIYRYFTESKAVIKTERAFSHYVSDTVVKKILEDPDKLKLGGVKRELTVFFSDIADFTKISETLKPEDLVNQLNDYLDAMGETILKREGTLDKFIGDAIVAFWGAPVRQTDHAARACYAALDYQKKLENLRAIWKKNNELPFHARIGINTGEMIVGNMGSNKRFDYTVIGDNVNLGARLEGANKFYGTEILISDSTYKEVKEKFVAREIDIIKVRGKTKVVRIYELMAKKGEMTDEQKSIFKTFHTGLIAYRQQDWNKAIEHFELSPDDGPSKVFIERCKGLRHKHLPKDWDGVFELTSK